ncbi:MAG TPA: helix-turn-helix transcriptional regulator [Lachnospiraceae bacterium]|nr:helix-turn-helix transcriptional regulator [Lachnospiraceae bacterium]
MNQIGIGQFIAKCRKKKNMTQSQLAEKIGITNQAVSKWETGKSMTDISIMLELSEILGITVNELLSGKELTEMEEKRENDYNTIATLVTKSELETMQMIAEILILAGIIIAITLTSLIAETSLQKVVTLAVGGVVWGIGFWLRIKMKKTINRLSV